MRATATYSQINSNEAIIEVNYPNGGFGMERVIRPRNGSLYEAAYSAAVRKAAHQGFTLDRFSKG